MPLRNYKTNRALVFVALFAVLFFHGGIIYAITHFNQAADAQLNIATEPATMTIHHINLAGVDTAAEITNQHDDEENSSKPEEEVKVEEKPEETEKPEEKPEEIVESEPVVEEPKEIITTKQPVPEAPKVQEKKKEVKKPQPKKQEPRPETKRQSKRVTSDTVLSASQIVILAQPKPIYSPMINRRNMKGSTVLLIKFDVSGKVVSTRIERSSGNQLLDKDHEKTARKMIIKPYLQEGKAISITVRREYQRN